MKQVNCSQVPEVNLLARHQSHRLFLKKASSLQAVSRDEIEGGLPVSKRTSSKL